MIRAAIFDLDGVVLDSMSIWRDLGARYLLHRGLTPEPGLGELLFSMSMEQGADYLRTHYPLPPEEDVLAGLSAMLRDFYYNEVPEKDGARTALAFLRDRGAGAAGPSAVFPGHLHHRRAGRQQAPAGYLSPGGPGRAAPAVLGGGGLPLCPANGEACRFLYRGRVRQCQPAGLAGDLRHRNGACAGSVGDEARSAGCLKGAVLCRNCRMKPLQTG